MTSTLAPVDFAGMLSGGCPSHGCQWIGLTRQAWCQWRAQCCMLHVQDNEFDKSSKFKSARQCCSSFLASCFFLTSSLSQLCLPAHASLVFGKVVASNVEQWKEPLEQGSDPCFWRFPDNLFTSFIWLTYLLPHHCKDAQSPCVGSLCAWALLLLMARMQ